MCEPEPYNNKSLNNEIKNSVFILTHILEYIPFRKHQLCITTAMDACLALVRILL